MQTCCQTAGVWLLRRLWSLGLGCGWPYAHGGAGEPFHVYPKQGHQRLGCHFELPAIKQCIKISNRFGWPWASARSKHPSNCAAITKTHCILGEKKKKNGKRCKVSERYSKHASERYFVDSLHGILWRCQSLWGCERCGWSLWCAARLWSHTEGHPDLDEITALSLPLDLLKKIAAIFDLNRWRRWLTQCCILR